MSMVSALVKKGPSVPVYRRLFASDNNSCLGVDVPRAGGRFRGSVVRELREGQYQSVLSAKVPAVTHTLLRLHIFLM